jgi:hypothetical protein
LKRRSILEIFANVYVMMKIEVLIALLFGKFLEGTTLIYRLRETVFVLASQIFIICGSVLQSLCFHFKIYLYNIHYLSCTIYHFFFRIMSYKSLILYSCSLIRFYKYELSYFVFLSSISNYCSFIIIARFCSD